MDILVLNPHLQVWYKNEKAFARHLNGVGQLGD